MNLGQLLFDWYNSPFFWPIVIPWLIIVIASERRKKLLGRLIQLLQKPIIFKKDAEPHSLWYYPRELLEDISNGVRDYLSEPLAKVIEGSVEFIKSQFRTVYDTNYPIRTFVYIIFLVLFGILLYGDVVVIINSLQLTGLYTGDIPPFLDHYEIPVTGATFLSVAIGIFIILETYISGKLTAWGEESDVARRFARILSFFIIVLGLSAIIALGMERMIATGDLEATPSREFTISLSLNILVLVSGVLAAALLARDAIQGLIVVLIFFQGIVVGVLYIANYIIRLIGSLFPFVMDIVWRVVFLILDILQYLLFTPIISIFGTIKKLFGSF